MRKLFKPGDRAVHRHLQAGATNVIVKRSGTITVVVHKDGSVCRFQPDDPSWTHDYAVSRDNLRPLVKKRRRKVTVHYSRLEGLYVSGKIGEWRDGESAEMVEVKK